MSSYLVRWEMEIEAGSPREAAERALAIHRNPESIATFFEVSGPGKNDPFVEVDLMEVEADE